MFGIALAIDYSLFILMRFREELRAGRDPEQAADAAMATSGLAVVLSGSDGDRLGDRHLPDPDPGAGVDGHRRDPRGRGRGADVDDADPRGARDVRQGGGQALVATCTGRDGPETTQSRFWTRWTGWVMRRPWLSALGATALLLTLAAPAFSMMLGNSMQRQFEPTHEIRGGVNAAAEALGPRRARTGAGAGDVPRRQRRVGARQGHRCSDALRQTNGAGAQRGLGGAAGVRRGLPHALLSAVLSVDPEDMGARETVDWMRAELPTAPGLGNARIDVGGPTALIKDFDDQVSAKQPLVFVFVALIAFVMLLISIRSVFLAFKGVLMTVLVGGGRLRQPRRGLPVGLARRPWASSRSRRWTAPSRHWCWR